MPTTPTSKAGPIFAIDLGKTTTRLDLVDGDVRLHLEGPGARLSERRDGVAAVENSLEAVLGLAEAELGRCVPVVAGVAGSLGLPTARAELARWLARRTGAAAVVTSDIVIAHSGAIGGGTGVCLIAGTGAVALGVGTTGDWRLVDGWGPDIGDFGGGAWIGRAGVQAVLNAAERGGASTSLQAQTELVRSLAAAAVADPPNAAGALGRFAPIVLDASAAGDPVADGIVERAVAELARTADSAATTDRRVAVVGGLTKHPRFCVQLAEALAGSGLQEIRPKGSVADGAQLLHRDCGNALEGCVSRAEPK